jgi:hypothetical protein
LDEYLEMRDDYLHRNLYLPLFEISAPCGFGEVWAHGYLKSLVPVLQRPSKKLDSDYTGQYDFLLEPNIRIEVKASRAVEFNVDAPLYVKALASDSKKKFDINFQQIKPACCIETYRKFSSDPYRSGSWTASRGTLGRPTTPASVSRLQPGYPLSPADSRSAPGGGA